MDAVVHTSRVPSHLKPFHPHEPTSLQTPERQRHVSAPSLELCPPRWRSASKPSLRSTLKAIICKDWPNIAPHPVQPTAEPGIPAVRPPMRMKDSDDYITARAANPRTGLISPSLPCTPIQRTPNSPGDALKLRSREILYSPTPTSKTRPPSRANEGRKISNGSAWDSGGAVECIWDKDSRYITASPEPLSYHEHPSRKLQDDQFVVHMPSAHEPDVTYPGYYSADQIAAFEHYKDKTRRVSNEGYDRRLVDSASKLSSTFGSGERDISPVEDGYVVCPITGRYFKPYRYYEAHQSSAQPPRIFVRKRKTERVDKVKQEFEDERPRVVDGSSSGAKPSSSALRSPLIPRKPRPTINRLAEETYEKIRRTVPTSKHAEIFSATGEISRETIRSAPSCTAVAKTPPTDANGDHYQDKYTKLPRAGQPPVDETALGKVDLSGLPRVRLVRPEHAGLPREVKKERDERNRQCSFGCQKSGSNGQCVERRQASTGTVLRKPLHNEPAPQTQEPETEPPNSMTEIFIGMVCVFLSYVGNIQIPKGGLLETLLASETPVKQKIDALKTLLSLAGHALAICTALAIVWKLGHAVMRLLEILLWPVAVPVRILRWLFGIG